MKSPTYDEDGNELLAYRLLGYSTDRNATSPMFAPNAVITAANFGDGQVGLVLYAVWSSDVILRFSSGSVATTGSMN